MSRRIAGTILCALAIICASGLPAAAQSFRVQCPTSTITHPDPNGMGANANSAEPAYTGPTMLTMGAGGYLVPSGTSANGAIKCQQISGGDGYSTMADGTQTFMFSFGPLSGLADMAAGLPGTEFPNVFNTVYDQITGVELQPGDPAAPAQSWSFQLEWCGGSRTRSKPGRRPGMHFSDSSQLLYGGFAQLCFGRTCGPAPDHGHRRDEWQHSCSADGYR